MFDGIMKGIKGALNRMFGKSMNTVALPRSVITDEMAAQIDHWVDLYYNRAGWLSGNKLTLGLPSLISREIATMVTLEAKVAVSNAGDQSDDDKALNPRAQFISDMLEPVCAQLPIWTEYACAFGGVAFRPYLSENQIAVDCINADNFYPTSFNARGDITGAIFVESKRGGDHTYYRIEEHQMLPNNRYLITNRAFKSFGSKSDVGIEIQLSEVPEWQDVKPEIPLNNIKAPLFSYFRIPQGNVVDVDSQLGVSVYARADRAGILKEIDRQFQRLMWEYEGGEMAIDATSDAFKRDAKGNVVLPVGKERLFRVNEMDSISSGSNGKFSTFAPSLRDSNYTDGLNKLLMRCEDLCGIARGTYSDVNETMRTATELKIGKQRTYATVTSIQMALQSALDALALAIDTLAHLYSLTPDGDYAIAYTWDDSIVIDAETEREKDRQDVLDGFMQAWEYRAKWYGETEAQAKAAMQNTASPVQTAIDDTVEDEPELEE